MIKPTRRTVWAYAHSIRKQFWLEQGIPKEDRERLERRENRKLTPKELQVRRHMANFTYMIRYLEAHPCKCGERDVRCLEFHHHEDNKDFTIATALWNLSLETIQKEIAKCVVLCANCHAKHHSRRRETATKYGIRLKGLREESNMQ